MSGRQNSARRCNAAPPRGSAKAANSGVWASAAKDATGRRRRVAHRVPSNYLRNPPPTMRNCCGVPADSPSPAAWRVAGLKRAAVGVNLLARQQQGIVEPGFATPPLIRPRARLGLDLARVDSRP